MRITIVLGAFLPVPPIMGGAVEKAWFELAKEFVRRGHDVVQVSRAVPEFPKTEIIDGVKHLRVPGFNAPASLLRLKLLDLVYSWRVRGALPHAEILVTNTFWLPALARASAGNIYVHVARRPKGQLRFYRRAARLQAPSRAVAADIVAEVPAMRSRVSVIPYPRPVGQNAPPPFQSRPKVILFVGRVHPEKGVHLLVSAFAALARERFGEWKLIIVGPHETHQGGGGAEYFETLRALAGPDERVQFRGPIFNPAELARAYNSARLFVYPSLAEKGETFGLSALEAMSRRCAVLTSNLDCFSDLITDGETALLFNHRASDALSTLQQKLEQIMSDEVQLARIAEAGYRKSEQYALEKVAQQFLEDFDKIVEASHV